jgi:hypothetical protein
LDTSSTITFPSRARNSLRIPVAGSPGGNQPADQVAFIQVDSQPIALFGYYLGQKIAFADCPLNSGACKMRDDGMRVHLAPTNLPLQTGL